MATEQVSWTPTVSLAKQLPSHPLSPLSAYEITKSSDLIKSLFPPNVEFHFKAVTLEEPEKIQVISYLDAEYAGKRPAQIDRRSFVSYEICNTVSQPRFRTLLSSFQGLY